MLRPVPAARRARRAAAAAASPEPSHRAVGLEQRVGGVGARLVDDQAVAQEDDPVGPGRVPGLVGDQHPGGAGVAAAAQQAQDLLAGVGVERAGRLVGQDQPPLADDRAGDGDPLLLAAGHLVGEPVGQVGDADLLQRGQRQPRGRPRRARRRARAAGRRSPPRSAPGSG